MGAIQVSVNRKGQSVERLGFTYDSKQRGLDTAFWKTIAATVSAASNKVRLASGGEIASYTQCKYGIFRFALNVATTPSTGEAKKWGLLMPSSPNVGAAYFEIAGAVFKAVSYDEDGNAESTVIAWDGWEAAESVYEIEWEKDYLIFKVDGVVVATHRSRVGNVAQPLYLLNVDADNLDLGYVTAKEIGMYV